MFRLVLWLCWVLLGITAYTCKCDAEASTGRKEIWDQLGAGCPLVHLPMEWLHVAVGSGGPQVTGALNKVVTLSSAFCVELEEAAHPLLAPPAPNGGSRGDVVMREVMGLMDTSIHRETGWIWEGSSKTRFE